MYDETNSAPPARVRGLLTAIAVAALVYFAAPSVRASSLPAGFTERNVITGLSAPNSFEFAPDGRIFICQQGGQLRVVDAAGTLLATPFITLTVSSTGERGLLGVALDPGFASNNYVYVYYTATTPTVHNRVSRFTANGNVAPAGSEVVLLDLDNRVGATNHNGGACSSAPTASSTSRSARTPTSNSQTLTNLLGKILRINSDGSIPTDNPFFNDPTPGIRKEIWAYGFRNPWRFTVPADVRHMLRRRRGQRDVGGSRHRHGREQLRMAWNGGEPLHRQRGMHGRPGHLRIQPQRHERGDHGRRVLSGRRLPALVSWRVLLRRFVEELHSLPRARAGNNVLSDNTFATGADGPVDIRYHDNAIWYTAINTGQLRRITYPSRSPLAGDWDFNTQSSIGLYTPTTGTFRFETRTRRAPRTSSSSSARSIRASWR